MLTRRPTFLRKEKGSKSKGELKISWPLQSEQQAHTVSSPTPSEPIHRRRTWEWGPTPVIPNTNALGLDIRGHRQASSDPTPTTHTVQVEDTNAYNAIPTSPVPSPRVHAPLPPLPVPHKSASNNVASVNKISSPKKSPPRVHKRGREVSPSKRQSLRDSHAKEYKRAAKSRAQMDAAASVLSINDCSAVQPQRFPATPNGSQSPVSPIKKTIPLLSTNARGEQVKLEVECHNSGRQIHQDEYDHYFSRPPMSPEYRIKDVKQFNNVQDLNAQACVPRLDLGHLFSSEDIKEESAHTLDSVPIKSSSPTLSPLQRLADDPQRYHSESDTPPRMRVAINEIFGEDIASRQVHEETLARLEGRPPRPFVYSKKLGTAVYTVHSSPVVQSGFVLITHQPVSMTGQVGFTGDSDDTDPFEYDSYQFDSDTPTASRSHGEVITFAGPSNYNRQSNTSETASTSFYDTSLASEIFDNEDVLNSPEAIHLRNTFNSSTHTQSRFTSDSQRARLASAPNALGHISEGEEDAVFPSIHMMHNGNISLDPEASFHANTSLSSVYSQDSVDKTHGSTQQHSLTGSGNATFVTATHIAHAPTAAGPVIGGGSDVQPVNYSDRKGKQKEVLPENIYTPTVVVQSAFTNFSAMNSNTTSPLVECPRRGSSLAAAATPPRSIGSATSVDGHSPFTTPLNSQFQVIRPPPPSLSAGMPTQIPDQEMQSTRPCLPSTWMRGDYAGVGTICPPPTTNPCSAANGQSRPLPALPKRQSPPRPLPSPPVVQSPAQPSTSARQLRPTASVRDLPASEAVDSGMAPTSGGVIPSTPLVPTPAISPEPPKPSPKLETPGTVVKPTLVDPSGTPIWPIRHNSNKPTPFRAAGSPIPVWNRPDLIGALHGHRLITISEEEYAAAEARQIKIEFNEDGSPKYPGFPFLKCRFGHPACRYSDECALNGDMVPLLRLVRNFLGGNDDRLPSYIEDHFKAGDPANNEQGFKKAWAHMHNVHTKGVNAAEIESQAIQKDYENRTAMNRSRPSTVHTHGRSDSDATSPTLPQSPGPKSKSRRTGSTTQTVSEVAGSIGRTVGGLMARFKK